MFKKAIRDLLNLKPQQTKKKEKRSLLKKKALKKEKTEPANFTKSEIKNYQAVETEKQPDWFDLIPEKIRDKPKKIRLSWMSDRQKHLLFCNPGEVKCKELVNHFKSGAPRPMWSVPFPEFQIVNNKVVFEGKKLCTDKQKLIRETYFNPRLPKSIEHIAFYLQKSWCNISKANVRNALRRIPTYQQTFGRRKPQDLKGIFQVKERGVIAYDLCFPDTRYDNKGQPILVCLDIFTRYCWVRSLENKKKVLVQKVIAQFLSHLVSNGVKISVLLSDRGSEFSKMDGLAKRFGAKVLQSPTGKPILAVESMISQVKRRMEVFFVSGLIDDSSFVTREIERQLNEQPIRNKQNFSPTQLLRMSDKEIRAVYVGRREFLIADDKQLPLGPGDFVRYLTWTRKEQLTKSTQGFKKKWSDTVHRVENLRRIKVGVDAFRYKISGVRFMMLRHELLLVPPPSQHDTIIPDSFVFKQDVTYEKQDYEN